MHKHLSEKEIRPEGKRQYYWDLLEKEVTKLLDEQNKLKKEFQVNIVCPLCNQDTPKPLFEKRGFDFVQCPQCDLVYVNPIPSQDKISDFYNSEALNYMQQVLLKETADVRKKKIHIPRAQRLKKIVPKGKLLELGCAVGYFLEVAQEVGEWQLYGVEANKQSADYVRQKLNIEIYAGLLEKLSLPANFFDVIVSFEVIEHITNPLEVVSNCYSILKKGGYLLISTPNIAGYDFQVLGKNHRSYSPPGHLVYFTPDTFTKLLQKASFSDVEITTPGLLDVENVRNEISRNSQLNLKLDQFTRDFLMQDTENFKKAREEFQTILARNKLSSHMIALCKK